MPTHPLALVAIDAAPRTQPSNYPELFRSMVAGRVKRPLGDLFGLTHFGVNLTTLPPGTISALRHAHTQQDEFVYVVSGQLVLLTDEGRTELSAGMCAGFKAGTGNAHQLRNESTMDAIYLEVGDPATKSTTSTTTWWPVQRMGFGCSLTRMGERTCNTTCRATPGKAAGLIRSSLCEIGTLPYPMLPAHSLVFTAQTVWDRA